MDDFDRKLLGLVQRNAQLTAEELAEQVHLSATSVRRRLAALRKRGVIESTRAILSPASVGETVIVSVRMAEESRASYRRFQDRMLADARVTQCYTVSGPVDFVVVAIFPSLADYERWIDEVILADDSIARSDTNIVYRRVKYETAIPV